MSFNLRQRSFLKLLDFSSKEIKYLLDLSRELKIARQCGEEKESLKGKHIVLIFEKTSTRTRCAFEVAAGDLGMHITCLDTSGMQLHTKESVKDTARVLGRMFSVIAYRGFSQETVESLAKFSGIPVINALTDDYHPTQVVADLLTMQEHCDKPLRKMSCCFLGDARNNMTNSLLEGASRMGMDLRIAAPSQLYPSPHMIEMATNAAKESRAKILLTESVAEAVKGVDFIYTDVWVSMGENQTLWADRIKLLEPYQVNMDVMDMTHNPKVRFMHCLPAFHNADTELGAALFKKSGLNAMEVTDEVFESPASIVFDQAENRLHTTKAILVAMLSR